MIAHEPRRVDAARRLARALRTSQVSGVNTNLDMLVATLGDADFLAAATPTAYLDEHPHVLTPTGPHGDDRVALLLGAVLAAEACARSSDRNHGFAPSGFRNLRTHGQRALWTAGATGAERHHVEYLIDSRASATVWLGPWPTPTEDGSLSEDVRRIAAVRMLDRSSGSDTARRREVIELDGRRHVVDIDIDGSTFRTRSAAGSVVWALEPRFVEHEIDAGGGGPICPLPGTVIAVHVEVGQSVDDGDVLMVVEAMKMEHQIIATGQAVVTEVRYSVGDRVDQGDLLVALDVHVDTAADDGAHTDAEAVESFDG